MNKIVLFLEFFAGLIIYVVFFLVRLALIFAGIVFFVPVGLLVATVNKRFFTDGKYKTLPLFSFFGAAENITRFDPYTKSFGELYFEMAIRNPTMGLAGKFKQPIPEEIPNPDDMVRGTSRWVDEEGNQLPPRPSAKRFMQAGFYWEYWSLSRIDEGHWAARITDKWVGRFWEFRVGWKFVDGNENFYPTFQPGPKE